MAVSVHLFRTAGKQGHLCIILRLAIYIYIYFFFSFCGVEMDENKKGALTQDGMIEKSEYGAQG